MSKSDIEIAREAKLNPIESVAERLGIPETAIHHYGRHIAKIDLDHLRSLNGGQDWTFFASTTTATPAALSSPHLANVDMSMLKVRVDSSFTSGLGSGNARIHEVDFDADEFDICPGPVTLTSEGAGQVVNGTATDPNGNSAMVSVTVNIDKTAPTLTATRTPPPNTAGWNNTDVDVSYTCSDALSGDGGRDWMLGDVGQILRARHPDGTPVVDSDGSWHRDVLLTELYFFRRRRQEHERVFRHTARLAPAFGVAGSVVGLIGMLTGLGDTGVILKTIPLALTSTLYGIVLCNLVLTPVAESIYFKTQQELLLQRLILEGVVAVQQESKPNRLERRLLSFLTPAERPSQQQGFDEIHARYVRQRREAIAQGSWVARSWRAVPAGPEASAGPAPPAAD